MSNLRQYQCICLNRTLARDTYMLVVIYHDGDLSRVIEMRRDNSASYLQSLVRLGYKPLYDVRVQYKEYHRLKTLLQRHAQWMGQDSQEECQ